MAVNESTLIARALRDIPATLGALLDTHGYPREHFAARIVETSIGHKLRHLTPAEHDRAELLAMTWACQRRATLEDRAARAELRDAESLVNAARGAGDVPRARAAVDAYATALTGEPCGRADVFARAIAGGGAAAEDIAEAIVVR